MSRKPLPPTRGGIAGVALLFCVSAGAAGFAFDLLRDAPNGFWILTEPGGRAALGAGAVAAIVLLAHVARLLLVHRRKDEEGGRDARDHP